MRQILKKVKESATEPKCGSVMNRGYSAEIFG